MRIGIANDLPIAVEAMRRLLVRAPGHHIAWIARDGVEAVEMAAKDRPDVILMDLIMPRMNGVEATRAIMTASPCAILVVTANVDDNARFVFDALGAGAVDAVNTPRDLAIASGEPLLRKLAMIETLLSSDSSLAGSPTSRVSRRCRNLLAIGASAGGPAALATLLSSLKSADNFAIVLVQHVDIEFTRSLAEWLTEQAPIPVDLAAKGMDLMTNRAVLAGSEDHLVVRSNGSLGFVREPADCIYRPSVDVLFASIASSWEGKAVGVLLTGMGKDGAAGLLQMRQAGHHTIAQDQASCAVFGMPKAAITLGAAVEVLSIPGIAAAVHRQLDT